MSTIRFDDMIDDYIKGEKEDMFEIHDVDRIKEWLIDIINNKYWNEDNETLLEQIDEMEMDKLEALVKSKYLEDIYEKIEDSSYDDELIYEMTLESFQYELGRQCVDAITRCNCNTSDWYHFFICNQKDNSKLICLKNNKALEEIGEELFKSIRDFHWENSRDGYDYSSLIISIDEKSLELSMGYVDYIIKPIDENMYELIDNISNYEDIEDVDTLDILNKYINFVDFADFIIETFQERYNSLEDCLCLYETCLELKKNPDFEQILNSCTLYDAYDEYNNFLEIKDDDRFIEFLKEYNGNIIDAMEYYNEYQEMLTEFLRYQKLNAV